LTKEVPVLDRIVEGVVRDRLRTHGAVLLEGPKAVGKTTTAMRLCASAVRLDRDAAARQAAEVDPSLVLDGAPPRLLDEFQLAPGIWNAVRGRVDDTGAKGLYVLTGSATPADEPTSHSGAGRIARVPMRTLTFFERGLATGRTSLRTLLDGTAPTPDSERMGVRDVVRHLAAGGWPTNHGLDTGDALDANVEYLHVIVRVDLPRVDGVRRDPDALTRLVRGFARNVATDASLAALAQAGETSISVNTRTDHVRALGRLYLIEDQPAWSPRLRSRIRLAATPKRHLADPSLAVAALGATPERLLSSEIEWTGFLFESQVVHDLRVLAQPLRAEVRFYRDNKGLEVDAIVERRDGRWLGVETKLGAGRVDEGAAQLLALRDKLDPGTAALCAGLIVVAADTPTYVRPDGVLVTSLASLGP
jgi:uncharacterized protein